jgi:hypothetical protein
LTVFARRSTAKGPRPEWAVLAGLLVGALLNVINWWFK